jgi:hypothetical protein
MNRYKKNQMPPLFNHKTYRAWKEKATKYTKEELYENFPVEFPATSLDNLTTPGMTITVKELKERYEKGRPIPVD